MTHSEIFMDQVIEDNHSWSITRVIRFIQCPVTGIMRMGTHIDGALLKDLFEIEHNYSLDLIRLNTIQINTNLKHITKLNSVYRAYGGRGNPSPGMEDAVPDNVISGGSLHCMDLSIWVPKKSRDAV